MGILLNSNIVPQANQEYGPSFELATLDYIVVFLGGLFWSRGTAQAALATLGIGFPAGLAAFVTGQIFEMFDLQFLYAAGLLLALSLVIYVTVSLITPAPDDKEIEGMVWSRYHWHQETKEIEELPMWQNPRFLAVGLAIITVVSVVLLI